MFGLNSAHTLTIQLMAHMYGWAPHTALAVDSRSCRCGMMRAEIATVMVRTKDINFTIVPVNQETVRP